MSRKVKRLLIDQWLDTHYPNALSKLSIVCGLPAQSLTKIRYGRVPKHRGYRLKVCEALGVDEDDLFPPIEDEGDAS